MAAPVVFALKTDTLPVVASGKNFALSWSLNVFPGCFHPDFFRRLVHAGRANSCTIYPLVEENSDCCRWKRIKDDLSCFRNVPHTRTVVRDAWQNLTASSKENRCFGNTSRACSDGPPVALCVSTGRLGDMEKNSVQRRRAVLLWNFASGKSRDTNPSQDWHVLYVGCPLWASFHCEGSRC